MDQSTAGFMDRSINGSMDGMVIGLMDGWIYHWVSLSRPVVPQTNVSMYRSMDQRVDKPKAIYHWLCNYVI